MLWGFWYRPCCLQTIHEKNAQKCLTATIDWYLKDAQTFPLVIVSKSVHSISIWHKLIFCSQIIAEGSCPFQGQTEKRDKAPQERERFQNDEVASAEGCFWNTNTNRSLPFLKGSKARSPHPIACMTKSKIFTRWNAAFSKPSTLSNLLSHPALQWFLQCFQFSECTTAWIRLPALSPFLYSSVPSFGSGGQFCLPSHLASPMLCFC